MKKFLKLSLLCLLLIPLGIFAFHVYTLWNFTVDDAFISFRYAEHLAHHGKPLWNLQQPPVEGYTSFLDIILLSMGFLLHIPILVWAKYIGIFSIIGIGIIYCRQILTTSKLYYALCLIMLYSFFLIDRITAIHAVSGLETSLYLGVFFITLFLYSELRFTPWIKLFSFCCLLLGLTRPEANLYNLLLLISTALYLPTEQKKPFLKAAALFYILPGMLYFIGRVYYFGILLPLPFYIKFQHSGIHPGEYATFQFLQYYWPLFISTLIIWAFLYQKNKSLIITYALIFISAILFCVHAVPLMDYSFRYCWPLLALVLVSGLHIHKLTEKTQKWSAILLFIATALCLSKNYSTGIQHEINQLNYAKGMQNAHILLGKTLSIIPSQHFLVTCDAGAIPFYSKWPTTDSCALNNKTLATSHFSAIQTADYIFAQHPRIIILISNSPNEFKMPALPFEEPLYKLAITAKMECLKKYEFQSNYYLWVMGYSNDHALITTLNTAHH